MPGLHPLRDRPEPEPGPYGHDQTDHPVETLKFAAALVAAVSGGIFVLGVVGGASNGWLAWLAPLNAFAASLALGPALGLAISAHVARDEIAERAKTIGLAAVAALLVAGASSIWLGAPDAKESLESAAADCRERKAAAAEAQGAQAFEFGRSFQKSGCPGIIEAADNL